MKAVNQLLAGIHICAAAEATAFAKRKGMDLDAVFAVVSKGAASSYCMKDRASCSTRVPHIRPKLTLQADRG
jgi:3-hydroxyisobutyrate dehydrogenase-like beta-hydroxyacid dehydrogenase